MVGLREQNKALRREAILDATFLLLSENEASEITTSQIAQRADVSAATVFNLIGTRKELLIALGARVIEILLDELAVLEDQTGGDPLAAARLIVDASVAAFTAEPTAYRRLVAELTSHREIPAYAGFDPATLQAAAMQSAQDRDIIDHRFDPSGLGIQIFASYAAAINRWALGTVDDDGFLLLARHGLLTVLVAASTDAYREVLRDELIALSKDLATASPQPKTQS